MGSGDPRGLALLDSMLRVAPGLGVELVSEAPQAATAPPKVLTEGQLLRLPDWEPTALGLGDRPHAELEPHLLRSLFRPLTVICGVERTPKNAYDLVIWETMPGSEGSLLVRTKRQEVRRITVPFAPGAFVLVGLLEASEAASLLAASEAVGYVPDEPSGRTASLAAPTPAGLDERAENFTWLADESVLRELLDRCESLLPQTLADGSQICGINARFRFYRCCGINAC